MQRDYLITVSIDGRPRSGRWKLLMGGQIRVTCNWGVDTVGCAPSQKPDVIAGALLEQIIRGYATKRAEQLAQEEREVEAVNRYWDRKQRKKPAPRDA